MGASSAGWAGRSNAVFFPNSFTLSLDIVDGISGVQTGPGATPLTRICFFASAFAIPLVMFTRAALVGE